MSDQYRDTRVLSPKQIRKARCAAISREYAKTPVASLKAHLRIEHGRYLGRDASLDELRRAWRAFHPDPPAEKE